MPKKTDRDTVVVLGNGKSRLQYDLDEIKKHAYTIGCNALYRDWTPDVLVATDVQISAEIVKSGYTKDNDCFFRHWNLRVPMSHKDMILMSWPQNTTEIVDYTEGTEEEAVVIGLSAVDSECNALEYSVVYIVGVPSGDQSKDLNEVNCDMPDKETMEFVGPNAVDVACHLGYKRVFLVGFDLQTGSKVNNIYAGSDKYKEVDSDENEKMPQSILEMARVFKENPNVEFIDVNFHDNRPVQWMNLKNYRNVVSSQTKSLVSLLTSKEAPSIIIT